MDEEQQNSTETGTSSPSPSEPGGTSLQDSESEFRWKQARENLLSPSGIRMFQLAYAHRNEDYESARQAIDAEYARLSPRISARGGELKRHGGSFINFIGLLEELGLMHRLEQSGQLILKSTPAGDQMAALLNKAPNVLRVIPYFLLDVLSRYSLNNPLNQNKNEKMREQVRESDLFPYWTLYYVMRSLGNKITKEELQRFVFKLQRSDDTEPMIKKIKAFRNDKSRLSEEELDEKYGLPITGAAGQPKYIMGRAGFQSGVIRQDGDVYHLEPAFLPFIDEILSNPPTFEELDSETWVSRYGNVSETTSPVFHGAHPDEDGSKEAEDQIIEGVLPDTDPILQTVRDLLFIDGFGGVILVGPPGTGKTFYAHQIAIALTEGRAERFREIQFHPSYQYEDFVEGNVSTEPGKFEMTDKHLLSMCEVAKSADGPVVLVIDEFSRSDPVRVMGEALTYMDRTQRGRRFYLASGRSAVIPDNLYFIATMNPEDRSVDEMDAAMDRRWAKVPLSPDPQKVNDFLSENGLDKALRGKIVEFFRSLQDHAAIGHAFFKHVHSLTSLERLWENQLRHVIERQNRYTPDVLKALDQRFGSLLNEAKTGEAEDEDTGVTEDAVGTSMPEGTEDVEPQAE